MIIGTIMDTVNNGSGGNSQMNGGSSVIFYTEEDASAWCEYVSVIRNYGAVGSCGGFTIMVNTSTGNVRWWHDGQEATA